MAQSNFDVKGFCDVSQKISDVVNWFGNQTRMARALKVDRAAVSAWVKAGALPPARAIQIEQLSGGKFSAVDLIDTAKI